MSNSELIKLVATKIQKIIDPADTWENWTFAAKTILSALPDIEELQRENERLKKRLQMDKPDYIEHGFDRLYFVECDYDLAKSAIDMLKTENQRYKEALYSLADRKWADDSVIEVVAKALNPTEK